MCTISLLYFSISNWSFTIITDEVFRNREHIETYLVMLT